MPGKQPSMDLGAGPAIHGRAFAVAKLDIPVSLSNPALRILLRAFGLMRDAIQRIAQAFGLTPPS